jgi:hypothetical protein
VFFDILVFGVDDSDDEDDDDNNDNAREKGPFGAVCGLKQACQITK